ncbi:hypothetical protein ECEC1868_2392, partial [Escherichia coli EC1868]
SQHLSTESQCWLFFSLIKHL